MAINSSYSFLVIFAFFVGSSLFGTSTALGNRKNLLVNAEAFVPVNPNDPKVVDSAKFAIDVYNKKTGAELSFNHVAQAASKIDPEGTNYGLIIKANDITGLGDYQANVIVNKDGSNKLIAFRVRNI